MWGRIANWYRKWEDEHLALMEDPSLAAKAPSLYLRYVGNQLADLSSVERQQVHAFSLAYRGRRGFLAVGVLCLAFTLAGIVLHLVLPDKFTSWGSAILIVNLLGSAAAMSGLGAWFNFRKIANGKLKTARGLTIWATLGLFVALGVAIPTLDKLHDLLAGFALGLGLTVIPLIGISVLRNRQYEKRTEQLQRDAERERLARELSESQLRLLRAQIEPHFLFNTLGAVQQLAEQDAPRAAELTANLIAFLRASLSEMRTAQTSLRAEFGLVDSYLRVMQVRLGERLRFTLTLPDELAHVKVPSMILLTLAENSIKHGIEPSLHGGEVKLSAEAVDGMVRLRVHDSGVGMSVTPGAGLGLENVRHRLLLAYPGSASKFELQDADPGMIADILIPSEH